MLILREIKWPLFRLALSGHEDSIMGQRFSINGQLSADYCLGYGFTVLFWKDILQVGNIFCHWVNRKNPFSTPDGPLLNIIPGLVFGPDGTGSPAVQPGSGPDQV